MSEKEDKLEIIEGDGSGINMSPVSNYIISMQPKTKKKSKNVVIPNDSKNKKKFNKKKKDNEQI